MAMYTCITAISFESVSTIFRLPNSGQFSYPLPNMVLPLATVLMMLYYLSFYHRRFLFFLITLIDKHDNHAVLVKLSFHIHDCKRNYDDRIA